ncbi:LysR family transcriptional regulator [Alkalilacustris brevis]|uniref:LysR family transcriptional regulator n=1 Tax=Alkalilacustris brevis TaxID=2026338 RepID=UPI0013906815|nr:LysR family transcriptional regulator [Alkalilacustris brevis]
MPSLRQLRSVVAVYEEGAFTRAAQRENATQSGISQHVSAIEGELGTALFERRSDGVLPTAAGRLFYRHALAALRAIDVGVAEVQTAAGGVAGDVRVGLMPTFTRAALASAVERFLHTHPLVRLEVIEGYSGALSDMVRTGALDFAIVPGGGDLAGLAAAPLSEDSEMLLSNPKRGLAHLRPVCLADLGPLKVVVPGKTNVRRSKLESYFATHGVQVARLLEMDSMFGTLELVARSDWVTVLPGIICVADADGTQRRVNPLANPPLRSEFVVIERARHPASPAARAFLETLRDEIFQLMSDFSARTMTPAE